MSNPGRLHRGPADAFSGFSSSKSGKSRRARLACDYENRLGHEGSGPPTNDQAKKSGAVTPHDILRCSASRAKGSTVLARSRTLCAGSADAAAFAAASLTATASNAQACSDISDVFQITAKVMRGKEWMCDIEEVSPDGTGWMARLSCGSEGYANTLTSSWQIVPEGRLRETVKTCQPSRSEDAEA
jgi:hypothetical protein